MSEPKNTKSQSTEPQEETKLLGQLEDGLGELKNMANELGERLSGAATGVSSEARERWKKMEPQVKEKLQDAERTLEDVSDSAAAQLKGLFGELKSSMQSLKDKL